jgi:hypothetical protein
LYHQVENSEVTKPKEPLSFTFTRPIEFKSPWVDSNEPVMNYKKHRQTCIKNRKKRKNKKRIK